MVNMEDLKTLRVNLGWTVVKLASEAGVTRQAVAGAEKGIAIRADVAKAIADALSKGYGRDIKPSQIPGLTIL
jgi:transcriptional regulator with XRE-family HTH domain